MERRSIVGVGTALLLLAGCAAVRWSGYGGKEPSLAGEWSAADLVVSTEPAKARPAFPEALDQVADTLYYSDLGPDTIDVSGYPAQQKYNYGLFTRHCGRCHTLARAVNSPTQSRAYWHFHLARMNVHSRLSHEDLLTPDEIRRLLDFMEYDGDVRKVQNKRNFEALTEELKRRFDPTLRSLLEKTR